MCVLRFLLNRGIFSPSTSWLLGVLEGRRAALKEKEQTNGHLKISAKPWGVLHRKMRSLNPPHTEGYDLLSMELSLVGFE